MDGNHPNNIDPRPKRAAQPQESVEDAVARRVEAEVLHRAIAQLPEKQRHRLVLYYFGDFTYQQIAEMPKLTILSIKPNLAQRRKCSHLTKRKR